MNAPLQQTGAAANMDNVVGSFSAMRVVAQRARALLALFPILCCRTLIWMEMVSWGPRITQRLYGRQSPIVRPGTE